MSEHIPPSYGELKPYPHGFNLYETVNEPKAIIRLRSTESLIDMMGDCEDAWVNKLDIPPLQQQDTETQAETVNMLIQSYENELSELEKWGITAVSHSFWIDHVKGESTVVCAADKVAGKHIGRAFDRYADKLDFEKFPDSVWRSYGRALSNVLSYYEDVLMKEKFFISDLTDPRQWVYDEAEQRTYLVDLDPTMFHHNPAVPSDDLDLEVGNRLITRASELSSADYMPYNDKLRTLKVIENLRQR